MAEVTHGTLCASHTDRLAVAQCDNCGRPACSDCTHESVAAENIFCSQTCREAAAGPGADGAAPSGVASHDELLAGLQSPILRGWRLWISSLGQIATAVIPSAALLALVTIWAVPDSQTEPTDFQALVLLVVFLIAGGLAAAATGVILSQRHTGLVKVQPLAWTARRFLPWLGTWVLIFVITMVGFLLLVFPGIYLSLRLFWADEFALIHGRNPIRALKDSWELTRDEAGDIFVFQFLLGLASYLILIPAVLLAMGAMTLVGYLGGGDPDSLSYLQWLVLYTILLFVYGSAHGPEIVKFYGMRARRAL